MIEVYVGVNGKLTMGNGKTLCMVIDAYNNFRKGDTILSNFTVDFASKYDFDGLNDILKNMNNVTVLADELHVLNNAYNWNNPKSLKFRKFCTQLRKNDITLKVTGQVYNDVPKYMRRLGGEIFIVEKLHHDNLICIVEDNNKCRHEFHKYRLTSYSTGEVRFLIPHLIKLNKKTGKISIIKDYFYNIYDSNEVIDI